MKTMTINEYCDTVAPATAERLVTGPSGFRAEAWHVARRLMDNGTVHGTRRDEQGTPYEFSPRDIRIIHDTLVHQMNMALNYTLAG